MSLTDDEGRALVDVLRRYDKYPPTTEVSELWVAVESILAARLARSSDGLREQIRDTLAGHRWERGTAYWGCPCGERCPDPLKGSAHRTRWMREHVADAVLAAIEEGNR